MTSAMGERPPTDNEQILNFLREHANKVGLRQVAKDVWINPQHVVSVRPDTGPDGKVRTIVNMVDGNQRIIYSRLDVVMAWLAGFRDFPDEG